MLNIKYLISFFILTHSLGKAQPIPFGFWSPSGECVVSHGYFILSKNSSTGNLGGRSGADATCLIELTTYNWRGKSSACELDSSRVKSFLCDGSGCSNLSPNTTYYFAKVDSVGIGGASFTTNSMGRGPGNENDWDITSNFNYDDNVWTGRGTGSDTHWPTSGSGNHCENWSSSSSDDTGEVGDFTWDDSDRWSDGDDDCDESYPILCFVEPNNN